MNFKMCVPDRSVLRVECLVSPRGGIEETDRVIQSGRTRCKGEDARDGAIFSSKQAETGSRTRGRES